MTRAALSLLLLTAAASALLGMMSAAFTAEPPTSRELHWLVRVDPAEIGAQRRDEMPAEVILDCGKERALDPSSLRIFRADATGKLSPADAAAGREESLPMRWYDDSIPYDFPGMTASAKSASSMAATGRCARKAARMPTSSKL